MLIEEIDGPFPCQFGSLLIIAWCGIVMETVIHVGINVSREIFMILFKGFFIGWPAFIYTLVKSRVLKQQWRLDIRHRFKGGCPP